MKKFHQTTARGVAFVAIAALAASTFAAPREPLIPSPTDAPIKESREILFAASVAPEVSSADCSVDVAAASLEKSRLAILVFTRRDCPACVAARPDLDSLRRKGIRVVPIDVGSVQGFESAKNYNVSTVPDFYLVKYRQGSDSDAEILNRVTPKASVFASLFSAFSAEEKKIDEKYTRCVVIAAPRAEPPIPPFDATGIDAALQSKEPDAAEIEPSLNDDFVFSSEEDVPESGANDENKSEDFRKRENVRESNRPGILDAARDAARRRSDKSAAPDLADEAGLADRFGSAIAASVKKALEDKLDETKKTVDAAKNRIATKLFFAFLFIQVLAAFATDVATKVMSAFFHVFGSLAARIVAAIRSRARNAALAYLSQSDENREKK